MADSTDSKTYNRREGVWPEKLRYDLEQRLIKRASDFSSRLTHERLLSMALILDAAAPEPLNNEELGELLERLVRTV